MTYKEHVHHVIIHTAEEGGYWAEVPVIPGCATQGETIAELLYNLNEAVEGCLSIIVYPGEDGYWIAECSSLPGCISQGISREEALTNIREAINLYIEALEE